MIAVAMTDTDFGIGAVVAIVVAILLYRLFRREPLNRLVRLGIFLERERYLEAEHLEEPPPQPPTTTEKMEWPDRKPD